MRRMPAKFQFQEPPFLLRELSYMRDLPPERADSPRSELPA